MVNTFQSRKAGSVISAVGVCSCFQAIGAVYSLLDAVVQLVINEVDRSSPQALQAVKLLAQYLGKKVGKVGLCTHVFHYSSTSVLLVSF